MKKTAIVFLSILVIFAFLGSRALAQEEPAGYQQETSAYNNFKKDKGLSGDLRIDQFSGAAVYNYALTAPQGRNGLQPSLNLYYNSHNRSIDSWVGQGWSLSLGAITRSTRKGSDQLYTGSEFSLFLNGSSCDLALIDQQNQQYGCKAEAAFNKVEYDSQNNYWIVTDTLGVKYYFGQVNGSRQDSVDHSLVYQWLLDKVTDTNGNFYRIEYFKNQGQIYPASIYYTGHDQTDGPMVIEFNLETRTDETTSYASQFSVTTAYRLANIEITVDGALQTKYDLSYITGQNGRTSLLSSITQKAYQDQTEYSLPVTTFEYQENSLNFTEDNPDNWEAFNRVPNLDVDINGDSWVDAKTGSFIYEHNGRGWEQSEWTIPKYNNVAISGLHGDINGDKYPDLIGLANLGGVFQAEVYLNNRVNGFYLSDSWADSLPDFNLYNYLPDYGGNSRISFTDVNGDGLDDLIYAFYYGGQSQAKRIYLNIGSGFEQGYGEFPVPLANCLTGIYPIRCKNTGVQLVDINGDGLVDVFSPFTTFTTRGVYLNTGTGWEQSPNQDYSFPDFSQDYASGNEVYLVGGARLTDINTDGLIDLVISANMYDGVENEEVELVETYLNTGTGWELNQNYDAPELFVDFHHSEYHQNLDYWENLGVQLLDINNDGLMDLAKYYCPDGFYLCDGIWEEYWEKELYLGSNNKPALLSQIANGYGAETSIEYQASGRYFNEDDSFKNPDLPINLQTVKTIATTDGQGNDLITDYDYQDGQYYADPDYIHYDDGYTLNQFVGFGEVTAATDNQTVKSYYHQGGGVDGYELGEYDDSIYKKGRVYREEVYENDTLLSLKVNRWDEEDLGNDRQFVYLSDSLAYDVGEDGQLQFLDGGELDEGPGEVDGTYLTDLYEAQNFQPQLEPQLIDELSSANVKHYFLGLDENNQPRYQAQFYSEEDNNDLQLALDTEEVPTETGDGELQLFWQQGCTDWQTAVDYIRANNLITGPHVDVANSMGGGHCLLSRMFLPFDTSSLPDDAIVSSASLSIVAYFIGHYDNIYMVNVNTNNPTLNIDDYGLVEDVAGSELFIGDTGRHEFDFNSTALNWIDLNSYTILALRGPADFHESTPSINGHDIGFYTVEATGTNNDPYLTIEYSLNHAPNVPSDLETEGLGNPDDITDQTPEFTAVYNDDNEEDQAISYQLQVIEVGGSFDEPLWDSGQQDLNTPTSPGERSEEISYGGNDLSLEGFQYYWRMKFWDDSGEFNNEGFWSNGLDYFYMDGSAAPGQPTGFLTENRVEPRDLINQTPSFSAIYHDPNPIDLAKWYRIQVDDSADFSSPAWDSQKTLLNNLIDNGAWSEEIEYGDEPLEYDGALYYWRVKFWDDEGEEGT
ncbi:MAG TPA: toxin TcdB middle/N-terminal domain-containing protein, partial [Patescibacteria group bacterium]|nr:toxin TcdB middle/N-terminal domain-containing protein [Patescibacteria group bacterium]